MTSTADRPVPTAALAPELADDAVDIALAAAVDALGGAHRDGQVRMAHEVAAAFRGGETLLIQAGTGTGKSLAYLVPAFLYAGEDRRVIVATATLALQNQLVARDLPRIVAALQPVLERAPSFALLKGRHNYVCLDKVFRQVAEDDDDQALFSAPTSPMGRQAAKLRTWVDETETGDRDDLPFAVDGRVWRGVSVSGRECVGATKCPYGQQCFAEQAREAARHADVVVTNHAMLAIHAIDGVPVLPDHDAIVIDEGHELVDRATQAVAMELSQPLVERAASRSRRFLDAGSHDRLEEAGDALADALAAHPESGKPIQVSDSSQLLEAVTVLRTASRSSDVALAGNKQDDSEDAAALQRARGLVAEVTDVCDALLAQDARHVVWIDSSERRAPTLHHAPLSVATLLRTSMFDKTPIVVTSATLTLGGSFDALAASFGLTAARPGATRADNDTPTGAPERGGARRGSRLTEANWRGVDVGSPFDFTKQGMLYVPAHLPRPGRDGVDVAALDELASLIVAAGGRTLALFSSWRGVERAEEHLADALPRLLIDGLGESTSATPHVLPPPIPVLVQRRGDAVADLVKRFAADDRAVLLGTLSLWQGVDVPGRACTLVAIDRIPFPRPDEPLTSARSSAAEAAGVSGFTAVSVPRAALMLAQGVGRLIRSADDRGVVAILDSRLATAGYGSYLRRSLPPLWYTHDGDVVRSALARLDADPVSH